MFESVDMIVASEVWTCEEVRKLVPRTDPAREHFMQICSPIFLIMSGSLHFFAGLTRQAILFPNLTLMRISPASEIFILIHLPFVPQLQYPSRNPYGLSRQPSLSAISVKTNQKASEYSQSHIKGLYYGSVNQRKAVNVTLLY